MLQRIRILSSAFFMIVGVGVATSLCYGQNGAAPTPRPAATKSRPSAAPTPAAAPVEKRITRDDAVAEKKEFEKSARVALVVGVSDYPQGSGLNRLHFAAKDARQVAAELEQQGYLVRTLTNAEAVRGSIRRALEELSQALDPNEGSFLFYFSGHGFAQADGSNYLATYGTTIDDLKSEGLPLASVEDLLKKSGAKRQLMFVDACRNEPGVGGKSVGTSSFVQDRRQRLSQNTGLRVMYSTRAGTVSYEDDELQQGVFTYYLLKGLAGEASGFSKDDRKTDGLISFNDLLQFMVENMRSRGVKKGQLQIPYEGGESTGDFLVASKALGESDLRVVAQAAGDPVSAATPSRPAQPPPTEVATLRPAGPTAPAGNAAATQPETSEKRVGGIATIVGGTQAKLINLPQVWRNLVNNQFYSMRFDKDHLYISEKGTNVVVADLTLTRDKKTGVERYVGHSNESSCPGKVGAMEVTAWSPTRIESRIEVPPNPSQPICGKAFGLGFFQSWVKVAYIPE